MARSPAGMPKHHLHGGFDVPRMTGDLCGLKLGICGPPKRSQSRYGRVAFLLLIGPRRDSVDECQSHTGFSIVPRSGQDRARGCSSTWKVMSRDWINKRYHMLGEAKTSTANE
ncbi:hypothetical protein M8818_006005 [Zalaria obscura]|uniref:Uncharacterized protein n=1 Tax=Zalaria obscura TaxID=2024903 RepID=A0ACC3S7A3_9PEZI